MKPQQLLNRIARERGLECCHNGACIYGHPGGMQTNGGCQAMRERDVATLRRHVQALRSIAIELAARVINERKLYLVPADPAEVVAELRTLVINAHQSFESARDMFDAGLCTGYHESACIVAAKLGVES
jgi:hypothetical protein